MRAETNLRFFRFILPAVFLGALGCLAVRSARGHDVPTSSVVYNREVRAILQARCVSCHQEGGSAFSLASYADARPWAKAIEDEVLQRRMPPWSAVRGFAEFRNDPSLTMTQLQQIAEWVEGGVPEDVSDEDESDPAASAKAGVEVPSRAILIAEPMRPVTNTMPMVISGEHVLRQAIVLDGLEVVQASDNASFRITANLPEGGFVPLLWVNRFTPKFATPFLYRNPVTLPAGTVIKGLPAGAQLALLTVAAN